MSVIRNTGTTNNAKVVRSQSPPFNPSCTSMDNLIGTPETTNDNELGKATRCKSLPELNHSNRDVQSDDNEFDPMVRCRGQSESECQFKEKAKPRHDDDDDNRSKLSLPFVAHLLVRVNSLLQRSTSSTKKDHRELSEEQRLRFKLDYHFMTPYQKYKRGRKPWKLAIQILKIVIVTTQISLFGADRFASVSFFQHTDKALSNILIKGFDNSDDFSLYSRQDLVDSLYYANSSYHSIKSVALGLFDYENLADDPPPMEYCVSSFVKGSQNASSESFTYDDKITTDCRPMTGNLNITDFVVKRHIFDRLVYIDLKIKIHTIYLYGITFHHQPECFLFDVKIRFDNTNHDGKLRVKMECDPTLLPTCPAVYTISRDSRFIKDCLLAFDFTVIFVCALSCILCIRSLVKSIRLSKVVKKFFIENRGEEFTKWDTWEFINKWFPVIVISDCLSVAGSIYKVFVDERDLEFYNICSILLGLGVILVWIGLLRFLAYLKAYNILLITLRTAAPSLIRFMFCALFIFIGFTLCGWVVLGPYHDKFREFFITAQCLFSLLNGDDMFPTFTAMSETNTMIWIFSKFYLYIFISLFIYVVLSTFISIVGDTYERIKDWGRLPQTKIQQFVEGRKDKMTRQRTAGGDCHRCTRAGSTIVNGPSYSYATQLSSLDNVSQLSVESTSWE